MSIWRKADALKQPIQSATEKRRPLNLKYFNAKFDKTHKKMIIKPVTFN